MPTFVSLYTDQLDYELGSNDSAVLFTSVRRKHAVNEGLREFADLTECWTKFAAITCSNGVGEYDLNSTVNVPGADFLRLTSVGPEYLYYAASTNSTSFTVTAGSDLPRHDPAWLDAHNPGWSQSSGAISPESYYLYQDGGQLLLGFQPPLTISTSAAGVANVQYVALPSSLTADTNVPFTDTSGQTRTDLKPYHQASVHYAAHKLELLRKDTAASDRQMQKFLGYVTRFLQATRKKSGQTIRPARSYFTRAGHGRGEDVGPRAPWWQT